MAFLGATALCGIGDPLSLLLAEQAFPEGSYAAVAKIGDLLGSALAAVLGALALIFQPGSGHGRQRPTTTDDLKRVSDRTPCASGSLILRSGASARRWSCPR